MQKKFLVKVFDGRKEKFVAMESGNKILTANAKDALKYSSYEYAEAAIKGILIADEMAEELGRDFVKDEMYFTIIPVYIS